MSLGTLYLMTGAVLIFGAGLFTARKVFPRLHAKQLALVAMITFLTLGLIWMLLSLATRGHDDVPAAAPANQPEPLLQPNPD